MLYEHLQPWNPSEYWVCSFQKTRTLCGDLTDAWTECHSTPLLLTDSFCILEIYNGRGDLTDTFATYCSLRSTHWRCIQALNAGNSLAVLETGNSLSYNIAKPCSFAPHWHPRASETYILPTGTLTTMFSEESASKLYIQNLVGPAASFMPRGLLHNIVRFLSVTFVFGDV